MAYTRPTTTNVGGVWAIADWDADIAANFAASAPDIFTQKGELAAGTGADAMGLVSPGSDGQILTVASGETTGMQFATFTPGNCRASYNFSGTQVCGAGPTILNFDNQLYDTDSAVTTGANWKFTVPAGKGGYYLVTCNVVCASSADWEAGEGIVLYLYKDGAVHWATNGGVIGWAVMQATGTFGTSLNGACAIALTAAQDIDIRLAQGSDANLTVSATNTWIAITKLF